MRFEYRATNDQGQRQEGIIQASSQEAALQVLDRHGLYITFLAQLKEKPLYGKHITFFEHISEKELVLFSRQLAIMFKSRVSLLDSINTIGAQLKNRNFRTRIFQIAQDVEAGTAFSEALIKHPQAFSDFYINMVKRGETLGNLSDVLEYLADHLERQHQLKSKMKSALVYPMFIVLMAFVVVTLLTVFVLPNLVSILQQTKQELPLVTKIVIASSNFYRQWWWMAVLVGMALIVGMMRFSTTPSGRKIWHWILLKIPLFSSFLRIMYVSRFGENLSTLIVGGVPIVQALGISSKIVGNERYERIIEQAKDVVAQGGRVADVFEWHPQEFPTMFTQMIKVGEKSGALDKTLAEIVEFYRGEMNRKVDTLISLIEPLLIVVLGVFVGGLMASLMLPLYKAITAGAL